MRNVNVTVVAALLSLTMGVRGDGRVPTGTLGRRIEAFALQDYRGKTYSLGDWDDRELVVVAFLGTECPLAKLYAGRLQTLADKYGPRGVAFVGINPNVQDSVTELGAYARRHGVTFPLLKDVGNKVADACGATRTPEVFLLDQNRVVQYHGRIDDQYVVGVQRNKATREDLRAAIDELLEGKPVAVPETAALGCLIGRVREPNADSEVTYSNQIARLLNRRCVECHRPGEIGPFALTSYEETAGWGEMIAEVVRDRRMPPWHADPAHGHFANDRSLTDDEKELVFAWVRNGCPEGDRSQLPEPPQFTEGWQLAREPDRIIAMSDKPFKVPADGGREGVRYQNFTVDPGFTEDQWIDRAEVQPGNRAVVHHIIVYARPPEGAGSRGEGIFLTAYVPGLRLDPLPPGSAKRVPAGSRLRFQMHYTPNGSVQEDISRVGLIFADKEKVTHEVVTTEVANPRFRIPPGAEHHEVSATSAAAPTELVLLSLSPHMHLRGKAFRFEAIGKDGERDVLLDVPHYDFNWQTRYVLAEPLRVPAGTRIHCTAAFDNSEQNLANPDPSKEVRWGDQSWEEMMIGYFDVLLPRDDARKAGTKPVETELDVRELIGRIDKNKDGQISREEAAVNVALLLAFDRVDVNTDGQLDVEEVTAGLRQLRRQE